MDKKVFEAKIIENSYKKVSGPLKKELISLYKALDGLNEALKTNSLALIEKETANFNTACKKFNSKLNKSKVQYKKLEKKKNALVEDLVLKYGK